MLDRKIEKLQQDNDEHDKENQVYENILKMLASIKHDKEFANSGLVNIPPRKFVHSRLELVFWPDHTLLYSWLVIRNSQICDSRYLPHNRYENLKRRQLQFRDFFQIKHYL